MKNILILIVFFFSSLSLSSQNEVFEWIKISEGKDDEGIIDLTSDKQGNLYVVGFSRQGVKFEGRSETCLSAEGYVYFYAKFNPEGKLIWLRQYQPGEKGKIVYPEKIELDALNNIYIFGVVKGKVNISAIGKTHYIEGGEDNVEFLAKYNQDGSVIWSKVFKDGFYNNQRDFIVDREGNSYLLGFRANVAKISPTGEELFRTYLPNGFTPGAICLYKDKVFFTCEIKGDYEFSITLADGTIINGEEIKPKEGYFYNTEVLLGAISKYDGGILWVDLIRSHVGEEIKALDVDKDGNITMNGVCGGQASFGTTNKVYLPGSNDADEEVPFLVQYSENGKRNWLKKLDAKDPDKGGFYSVSLSVDQNTGNIYSTRTHCNDGLAWAVYFEKFNKNGQLLNSQLFGFNEEYKSNGGFWKSSCGTANFFVHIPPESDKLYLYGEGRSYLLEPKLFGSNSDKEAAYEQGTNFFICKKSLKTIKNEPNVLDEPGISIKTDWSGTWITNWDQKLSFKLNLTDENGVISGNYSYKNGKFKATRTSSTQIEGTWRQEDGSGWFRLKISDNSKTFNGEWGYSANEDAQGNWSGEKH